jgi:hypothetical protein
MKKEKYTEAKTIIETIEKRYAHPMECYLDGDFSHCDVKILEGAVTYLDEELQKIKSSQKEMKCFYEVEDLPNNFIAIYSDLSGCDIFGKHDDGIYGSPTRDLNVPDNHWFTDAGYLWFITLPDGFNGGE